jgi:regulator of sirC expression with transglutaminase-like and TPR domain
MSAGSITLWDDTRDAWVARCRAALAAGDLAQTLFTLHAARPEAVRAAQARLTAWGQAVLDQRLAGLSDADALRLVLVHGAGLEGARDDYFHPDSSDFAQVVQRRRGMPIMLSAVWMQVGLTAGVEVHGIGLPGHFIVRVGADQLIDPFQEGRRLSREECQAIAARVTGGVASWDDRYLRPISHQSLVARVIRNLIGVYQRKADAIAVYRFARLGAHLVPDDVTAALTWGRAAELLGARREAVRIYRGISQRFGHTPHARAANARAALLEQSQSLH